MNTQDMHNALIIAKVKMATGLSLRKLSIQNGLSEQACKRALERPYAKPEQVIANAIGVPPHSIWPSRYNVDGSRVKGLHSSKSSSKENSTPSHTKMDEGQLA